MNLRGSLRASEAAPGWGICSSALAFGGGLSPVLESSTVAGPAGLGGNGGWASFAGSVNCGR